MGSPAVPLAAGILGGGAFRQRGLCTSVESSPLLKTKLQDLAVERASVLARLNETDGDLRTGMDRVCAYIEILGAPGRFFRNATNMNGRRILDAFFSDLVVSKDNDHALATTGILRESPSAVLKMVQAANTKGDRPGGNDLSNASRFFSTGGPGLHRATLVGLGGRYSNPVHPEKTLEELEQLVRGVADANDTDNAPQAQRNSWKLSKIDEQRLVTAYGGGTSVSELSRQFKVSRGRVRTILTNYGSIPCRRQPVSSDQLTQAVSLYAQGLSVATIAIQLGLTPRTLNTHLRKAGVTLRPRGGSRVRTS